VELIGTPDVDLDAADLAFLALVRHRLGHEREAGLLLARLRERVARPEADAVDHDRALLDEAASVIQDPARRPGE
jgi:hypothetical protein